MVPPGEGERATLLGMGVRLLYRQATGACSLVEFTVPQTSRRPPVHLHHHTEETFYVVEGVIAVQVDDNVVEGEAGTLLRVLPGTRHTFWKAGPALEKGLVTCTPAGTERIFFELASRLAASDGSPEQAQKIRQTLAA